MKQIRLTMALLALFVTLGVGFTSTSSMAAEEEIVAAGERCNCKYQSGSLGVIKNNDCEVVNCWTPLDQE
ncbi:MAG TPA: hypothetical protein VF766_14760 [Pyrinomonadaceae bacterium]